MKKRYNITLDDRMDVMLNRYSYNTRKSRSTLIEEALEQYFSGIKVEGHEDEGDRLSMLEERVEKLESEIQNIQRPDSSYQKKSPLLSPDKREIPLSGSPAIRNELPVFDKTTIVQHSADDQITIGLDPQGWFSQSFVAEFLDPSILLSTRKSIVSLAVARGEMETNGKKRKGCRIKGSSAIEWIISMKRKEKPPIFFLGSS